MKKLFNLSMLVACFVMIAATVSSAQFTIRNGTNCPILMKFNYGPQGSCLVTGSTQGFVVPANTSFDASIFVTQPGTEIKAAKGYSIFNQNCLWYVGLPNCTPYNLTQPVLCNPCGPYTTQLFPNFGIAMF